MDNTHQQPVSPEINQPVGSSNQSKKMIMVLGIIIALFIFGIGGYFLGANKDQPTFQNNQNTTSPTTVEKTSPTSAITQAPDSIPQENILYLGTYEGVDALFFTNKQKQEYLEPGAVKKTSPYIGALKRIDGIGTHPFDYKKLINPKRVALNIGSPIFSVESLKLNNTKTILYISLNLEAKASAQYPDNLVNKVYQVMLSSLSSNEIWSNDVGSSKYTGKGVAYIDQIAEDKFVSMLIGDCYACGGHTPTKTVILNIAIRSEKYMEGIGDIQFSLQSNTFAYKKLVPFKEPCEPSPGCDSDGTRTVMKPSGQVFSEKLP